jgi:hypothetical protein
MKFLQTNVLSILMLAAFGFGLLANAQTCQKSSSLTEVSAKGANMLVVFGKVSKVKKLQGVVRNPNEEGMSAIIEVYRISKQEIEAEPVNTTKRDDAVIKIETNEKGAFCTDKLTQGYYLLKVGSVSGGFNFTFLRIIVTNKGSGKPLDIALSLGI